MITEVNNYSENIILNLLNRELKLAEEEVNKKHLELNEVKIKRQTFEIENPDDELYWNSLNPYELEPIEEKVEKVVVYKNKVEDAIKSIKKLLEFNKNPVVYSVMTNMGIYQTFSNIEEGNKRIKILGKEEKRYAWMVQGKIFSKLEEDEDPILKGIGEVKS